MLHQQSQCQHTCLGNQIDYSSRFSLERSKLDKYSSWSGTSSTTLLANKYRMQNVVSKVLGRWNIGFDVYTIIWRYSKGLCQCLLSLWRHWRYFRIFDAPSGIDFDSWFLIIYALSNQSINIKSSAKKAFVNSWSKTTIFKQFLLQTLTQLFFLLFIFSNEFFAPLINILILTHLWLWLWCFPLILFASTFWFASIDVPEMRRQICYDVRRFFDEVR